MKKIAPISCYSVLFLQYFSKGTVSWETSDGELDEIYVYLYEVTNHLKLEAPTKIREGILDWKSIDWILNPNNLGIAEMVAQYLPILMNKADTYSLTFQDGRIHIL